MLLAGLGGLGAEVAKNLILAGVKGLTLLDHEQVHMFTQYTQCKHAFPLSSSSELTVACSSGSQPFSLRDPFSIIETPALTK